MHYIYTLHTPSESEIFIQFQKLASTGAKDAKITVCRLSFYCFFSTCLPADCMNVPKKKTKQKDRASINVI